MGRGDNHCFKGYLCDRTQYVQYKGISSDKQFADDTTLYASSKQLDEPFQKINNDWFKANKLSLNIAKTNYMFFPYRNDHTNNGLVLVLIRFNGKIL